MNVKQELEHLLTPPKPPEPPKAPGPAKRTLGNVYIALEAQRIYNPAAPSIPKPEAPVAPSAAPANEQDRGTAGALGTEGRWGTPEK
jgi:hypothetical protein